MLIFRRALRDYLVIILKGILPALRQAYFLGKPAWSPDQMPSLTGRTVIVTGGNAGIGKQIAKALLEHDAKVYLACRNETKALAAIKELQELTGKEAHFLRLDLADMQSIRAAAVEFMSKEKQLHVLFNNGGVMFPDIELEAAGYDLQFHTNVLGHFYLTKLLLPVLTATALSEVNGEARVVNTTSSAHYLAKCEPLDFTTFKDGPARRSSTTEELYIQSKFANVVFAKELARRYGDQGIVSTSINPGNLNNTNLAQHVKGVFIKCALNLVLIYPPHWGALTPLWAGTSPEGAHLNGKYAMPWGKVGNPRADALDPRLGKELWTWLEEQTRASEIS